MSSGNSWEKQWFAFGGAKVEDARWGNNMSGYGVGGNQQIKIQKAIKNAKNTRVGGVRQKPMHFWLAVVQRHGDLEVYGRR